MTLHLRTLTINSGQVLSDALPMKNYAALAGLMVPTVDSCALYVQTAAESGGPFTRLLTAAGSGDLTVAIGPGSRCWVPQGDGLRTFPVIRLEAATQQSAPRQFVIALRL